MVLPKMFLGFVLITSALAAAGQATPQQMQHVIGRISTEQKAWQQSKMPSKHFYKDNYAYSYPLYQDQPFIAYPNISGGLPAMQRLRLTYGYNLPTIPYSQGNNARAFDEWKKKYLSLYRENQQLKN